MEDASVTSLEAVEVVENLEHIFKALKKAGVSQGELASFSSAVQRGVEPRFLRSSSAPKSRRGTEGGDLNGEVLWDGVVERLERGKHGFAATWKRRFVQLRRGELICFAGPEPPMDNHAVTILPLALQTTTIEILNEVMCRRLGRPNALSVSTQKGIGKPARTITLAFEDDFELERWGDKMRSAYATDGYKQRASIHYCSKKGDIQGIDDLIAEGICINTQNRYGATPLHIAVWRVADLARQCSRVGTAGGEECSQLAFQESVRSVAHLMARGADPEIRDKQRERPIDLAVRLLAGLPKSERTVRAILDPSKYRNKGGIWSLFPQCGKLGEAYNHSSFDKWIAEAPSGATPRASIKHFGPTKFERERGRKSTTRARTAPLWNGANRAVTSHQQQRYWQQRTPPTSTVRSSREVGCLRKAPTTSTPTSDGAVGIFFKDLRFGTRRLIDSSKALHRSTSRSSRRSCGRVSIAGGGMRKAGDASKLDLCSSGSSNGKNKGRRLSQISTRVITNAEALRTISNFTRESSRLPKVVPPMEEWSEASSNFVSFDTEQRIADALITLKQESKGALVPLTRITSLLKRMGRPLTDEETENIRAVSTGQGYIHKDKFPAWLVNARLPMLPPGSHFFEQDDIVAKRKNARLQAVSCP